MLSVPSGATSESLANQSVFVAVEAATRRRAIGPASVSDRLSGPVRQVRPWPDSRRWSVGTYGVAATVPCWSRVIENPAAGSVKYCSVEGFVGRLGVIVPRPRYWRWKTVGGGGQAVVSA